MRNSFPIRRPVILIILVDLFAFTLLCFFRKSVDWYILLAGLLVVGMVTVVHTLLTKKSMGDEYLFLIVSMLTSLGFIMIYRLDRVLGFKQIFWFGGGILLFFAGYLAYRKLRFLDKLMFYYLAGSLALFAATMALGRSIKGSTNWITVAGYSFQPSELIKILFVLFLACYIGGARQKIFGRWEIRLPQGSSTGKLFTAGAVYAHLGFLILQREWGTILLLFLVYCAIIFVFEQDWRLYLANAAFAVVAAVGGYHFLNHIKVRVDMWLNPWADISGKGYQATQSLFAIATGGFFGTGLGLGRPDMIPEVNTDFIFSAICEEMGMFGGVAVILLFFLLCYRGFKIALTARGRFDRAVALGITVLFGIQTFIIVGGVIKLIPLTGITLPFVSYGGSSLTTSFIALGILQAVSSSEGWRNEGGGGHA